MEGSVKRRSCSRLRAHATGRRSRRKTHRGKRPQFHIKSTTNLIGFLGADAKVQAARDSSNNFTTLSLATQESWKNRDTGEWESRTEWHRIVVFGKLGEFAASLKKGAHIEVEGTLRSHERTIELAGSTKSNAKTHIYRTWSIRADSIRKLDRAERVPTDESEPESDAAE